MTEGSHIQKRCFSNSSANGASCGGPLRIEAVISDAAADEARASHAKVLHGVRCETCGAYYLHDPRGGRLTPK